MKQKGQRKGVKKAPLPTSSSPNPLRSINVSSEAFSDTDLNFWICHGVNCIVSDYDNGNWTPLFEGIYEGNLPDPEDIAQTVMDKYNVNQQEWPVEAKAALAWTVNERSITYVYYREALRRLAAAHGEDANLEALSREPHNPIVWAIFAYLKDKILKRK